LTRLYQPHLCAVPLAGLGLIGLLLALFVPRHRLALLPGAVVLGLLLASAALDGPVERYRYPLDPNIALLAAGGLTVSLERIWHLLTHRRRTAVAVPTRLVTSLPARRE
jgi:hypothetical protein